MPARNQSKHNKTRWRRMLLCAALIAPLTGCTPELIGFTAFNALYGSAIGFLPLRSVIGGLLRDTFVGIF